MKIQRNGYAKNEDKREITHNVEEVISILFGGSFKEDDINSFEKCFDIIKNNEDFKYKEKSNEILQDCAKQLKEKEKRLDFPNELEEYI